MHATAPIVDPAKAQAAVRRLDAWREDAYWQRWHRHERYFRPCFDYEDYAPAYCVGYIGCAQYGGEFEDALPSLCANWERIKGDSRLGLDEALLAMRSAWDRLVRESERRKPRTALLDVGQLRQRLRMVSVRLGPRLLR